MAVGGIGAHVQARVTVGHAPWTVTHALDTGLDQGELVRVHDGVDGLQRHVGHLHRPRHGAGLGPELVAERLPEANLPGDGGEVCHLASILLHLDLAVHHASRWGTVVILSNSRHKSNYNPFKKSVPSKYLTF